METKIENEYIEDNNLSVDTLVNNAGIGSFGEFKDIC